MPKSGRGWSAGEEGTRNLSQHLFSWAPTKKQMHASKGVPILPEERARRLPALVLLFPSSWPQLLVLAGKSSCLPVSAPVTITLAVSGRAQGWPQLWSGIVSVAYFHDFLGEGGEGAYKAYIHGLPCLMTVYHLVWHLGMSIGKHFSKLDFYYKIRISNLGSMWMGES